MPKPLAILKCDMTDRPTIRKCPGTTTTTLTATTTRRQQQQQQALIFHKRHFSSHFHF